MMRGVAGLVLLGACGRLGFGTDDSTDARAGDAAIVWGPFSAPLKLAGPVQTGVDEWYPAPVFDQTEVYFHRATDVWRATRASAADTFSGGTLVSELSAAGWAQDPALTADGLFIVFKRTFNNPADLYGATRANTTAAFDPPVSLGAINFPAAYNQAPCVSADGLRLLFSSNEGGTTSKLFEATRPDRASPFGDRRALDELHVAGSNETTPAISADGLELFFASDQAGGAGGYDAYRATRDATDQPFGRLEHLTQLSSAFDDMAFRLTPDGATIYFNYDTSFTGGRNADIWIATRSAL